MIAAIAALVLCLPLGAWILRAVSGPTLQDRALGVHGAALTACLLGVALANLAGKPVWIDIALAILVGDILITVMVLRLFRLRSLQTALTSVKARP